MKKPGSSTDPREILLPGQYWSPSTPNSYMHCVQILLCLVSAGSASQAKISSQDTYTKIQE